MDDMFTIPNDEVQHRTWLSPRSSRSSAPRVVLCRAQAAAWPPWPRQFAPGYVGVIYDIYDYLWLSTVNKNSKYPTFMSVTGGFHHILGQKLDGLYMFILEPDW